MPCIFHLLYKTPKTQQHPKNYFPRDRTLVVTVGPSFFPNGCAKAPVLEIPLPRIPAPREPRFQQPLGHPDLELTDGCWMGCHGDVRGLIVNHIGDCILTMVIHHLLNGMIFQVGIEKVSNPWDPASPNLGMVNHGTYINTLRFVSVIVHPQTIIL